MVIWVTGLSGAGKTTLCSTVYQRLKPSLPHLVLLDGDVVRRTFGNDLTHAEPDRVRQVRRLRSMAKVMAEQHLIVLVAVLYSHPELLAWNRENLPGYFEVHLATSLEVVMQRDDKGLYAAARAGTMKNVVGIDIPWHAPDRPDLVLGGDGSLTPDELADRLIRAVPQLAAAGLRAVTA